MAKKKSPAKKSNNYIAKAPIRRLMKMEGADIVAREAIDKLIAFLYGSETESKEKYERSKSRKRITVADINFFTKKDLIILHLSDLHFGMYNRHTGQIPFYEKIWEEIKKELESNKIVVDDIDLVAITGDLSSTGKQIEFRHARDFLKILFKDLDEKKFIIIPGNHDLEYAKREGMVHKRRFANYLQFKRMLGFRDEKRNSLNYLGNPHFFKTFDKVSVCILCLNSCLHTAYEADIDYPTDFSKSIFKKNNEKISKIDKSQLALILEAISSPDNYTYKIVLLHHNILGYNPDRAFLHNFYTVISEIGNCLKSYLILHGHLHRRIIDRYQNCVTIGAGSFGVNNQYKDSKNELNLIKIDRKKSPFPRTKVKVLTMTIDYEEPAFKAVKTERDWESEILEMPMSTYITLKSMDKMTKHSISEGNFELSKKNYMLEREFISQSEIDDKDFYKSCIASKHEPKLKVLNPAFRIIDSNYKKATSQMHRKVGYSKRAILKDRNKVTRSKY